jgi:L-lactate dehydrogenase
MPHQPPHAKASFTVSQQDYAHANNTYQSIKIVIVGAGSVGVTTAYALLIDGLASDLVLIDIDKNRALGEVMDLSHAAHFAQARVRVGDYEDCANAAAVIITAGVNQKPGQTRLDLVKTNYALFRDIVPRIAQFAPETILVVATNPVDVLTHAAHQLSGFPVERVIGSGTAMDTTRFRHELGTHFGVNPRNVHAIIVGEHGDSQLPVWSLATISGMRLRDYCEQAGLEYNEAELEACAKRTKEAAYEIIQRKGKTNYGVASVLVDVLRPIITHSDAIMTVSRVGTYGGVEDVALSMPCMLNRHGAYQDVPLLLSSSEKEALRESALSVKGVISKL